MPELLIVPTIPLLCLILACSLFAFVIGRISTAPAARPTFPIPTPKLAHILYEATRAYRASQGDLKHKSFNNLPILQRRTLVNRIAAFRRSPYVPAPSEPFERHLQAAIVAITDNG